MSSTSSQSDKITEFQELNSKWSEIELKFNNILNYKLDCNSSDIKKLFTDEIFSFIKIIERVSKQFTQENIEIEEILLKKMKKSVIEGSKILKDISFYEIKRYLGQNLQISSLVLNKFYTYGILINFVLKSEISVKTQKIDEIKDFHVLVLNYITHMLTDKNFLILSYFKLFDEKLQNTTNNTISYNLQNLLKKTYKYSLLKSIGFYQEDKVLLELCEAFLFKILKENENFTDFSEFLLGVFQVLFQTMTENYLENLYNLLQKANFVKELKINIDKVFFLNGNDTMRKIILESYKNRKIEEFYQFYDILKPLFFNDLLQYKPKSYFCFEKITDDDHLSLSAEIIEKLLVFLENILIPQFLSIVQIVVQGNAVNTVNFPLFEGLIETISSFMLNEQISRNITNFGIVDFLMNLEKCYRLLIPLGEFAKTINVIIAKLFEILIVKNKSNELKFQEIFKLFSIVAKDNSFDGLVNLSKFLRILSFATIPANYKNQVILLKF